MATKKPVDTDVFSDMEEDAPDARAPRSTERLDDRVTARRKSTADVRGLSKAELITKFRTEMFNNVLPSVPEIPDFHLCWLSSTNQYDSIAHREALGYERVKPEDLPGMDHITISQGAFAGCIGLNELVLFKLPLDLWHEYMRIAHDERPRESEERIREIVNYARNAAQEGGGDVYLSGGTQELMTTRTRVPHFTE